MFGLGLTKVIPLLVYLACIVVIILLVFVKNKSILGLYLATCLVPLQNLVEKLYVYPLGKDIMDILLVITLLSVFIHKSNKTDNKIDKSMMRPIIILAFCSYFSLWVGSIKFGLPLPITYASEYLIEWKNFMMLLLLYCVVIYTVNDRKEINNIIWLMIIITFMVAGYFYEDARWGDYSSYRQDMRYSIQSPFVYLGPNELAAFYGQTAIFMIGMLSLDKLKIRKCIYAIVICLNFYCIFFLFSRGTYIAVTVGLFFIGIMKNRKILLLLLVVFIAWHTILPVAVVERIEMTSRGEGYDGSSTSRLNMWGKAVEAIKINPVTGLGFGGTKLLGIKNDTTGQGVRRSIHNGYLTLLIEQGMIGFYIWMSMLWIAFNRGWKLFKKAGENDNYGHMKGLGLGFMAMVVFIMVDNLTGTNWFYLNVMGYFWIIFGLVMKANNIIDNEIQQAELV